MKGSKGSQSRLGFSKGGQAKAKETKKVNETSTRTIFEK